MAKVTIHQPVGIRNGVTMLPNQQGDLNNVRDLFDVIPTESGGTRDSIGEWATVRLELIGELTAQITIFQELQQGLSVDGAIDPGGNTLRRMNAIAASLGGGVTVISATVMHDVRPYSEDGDNVDFTAIDPFSMPGRGGLKIIHKSWSYIRRLVRVENCSIKWFGVLFNRSGGSVDFGTIPHIYFTPHPAQGGYQDPGYDSFKTWHKLWHDYTQAPGRQIVTANKSQVLVVPFYTNAQHHALGDFLVNWKEAVAAVVTAAIDSVDATELRSSFDFTEIYSTSFSDGWIPHSQFHHDGVGVKAMTTKVIDLDGQAAHPPSHWRPAKGIVYLDKPPPAGPNPRANEWYVGGRWTREIMADDWGGKFTGHAACSSYLLYHAMRQP
jgi:hypothetical protein